MTIAEAALCSLRSDVEAARRYQAPGGKGGQQCGAPPVFWRLMPSELNHLDRTCRDGLSEEAQREGESATRKEPT